jgi:hypothetical protein
MSEDRPVEAANRLFAMLVGEGDAELGDLCLKTSQPEKRAYLERRGWTFALRRVNAPIESVENRSLFQAYLLDPWGISHQDSHIDTAWILQMSREKKLKAGRSHSDVALEELLGQLTEDVVNLLADTLLGKKLSQPILSVSTNEELVPAGRKITRTLLRKLALSIKAVDTQLFGPEQKAVREVQTYMAAAERQLRSDIEKLALDSRGLVSASSP